MTIKILKMSNGFLTIMILIASAFFIAIAKDVTEKKNKKPHQIKVKYYKLSATEARHINVYN